MNDVNLSHLTVLYVAAATLIQYRFSSPFCKTVAQNTQIQVQKGTVPGDTSGERGVEAGIGRKWRWIDMRRAHGEAERKKYN